VGIITSRSGDRRPRGWHLPLEIQDRRRGVLHARMEGHGHGEIWLAPWHLLCGGPGVSW